MVNENGVEGSNVALPSPQTAEDIPVRYENNDTIKPNLQYSPEYLMWPSVPERQILALSSYPIYTSKQ